MSGFLLWQSAHSEFYFCEAMWPDFRRTDFLRAIRAYARPRPPLRRLTDAPDAGPTAADAGSAKWGSCRTAGVHLTCGVSSPSRPPPWSYRLN